MRLIFLFFSLFLFSNLVQASIAETRLTDVERNEVQERLRAFYSTEVNSRPSSVKNNLELMSKRIPKFNARTGNEVHLKPFMKWAEAGDHPLAQRAQIKASDRYQKYVCEQFTKKRFPNVECAKNGETIFKQSGSNAAVERNDKIETLLATFLGPDEIHWELGDFPAEAKTKLSLWSDDYWRLQWGATAYRYAEGKEPKSYKEFLATYDQPRDWKNLISHFGIEELSKRILKYSPAEKYDLTVGDTSFALTRTQRQSSAQYVGKDGNVEEWMGICHGWAAAAITVPRAEDPIEAVGPNGLKIVWNPHDIRAMASLQWANGSTATNNIGGRCNAKKPKTYPNGRLIDQNCFDTNPATFTLALGNMIGVLGHSFVMDKDFDYEVWNQPIHSYSLNFFNPLDPKVTTTDWNKDWQSVVVDYSHFKDSGKDRFQSPPTRGLRKRNHYDDSGIKYIVGVIATVAYVEETDAIYGPKAEKDSIERETYTYDLELHEEDGKLVPRGGEWHNNVHPDFLWVPKNVKQVSGKYVSLAWHEEDKNKINFTLANEADNKVTSTAQRASLEGYPLCNVIRPILEVSSNQNYHCR